MGTYLKFDGGKTAQSCRALGGSSWTSTGSIVLTCFVRILANISYTAPIIGVAESSVTYHGIWLTGRNSRSSSQYPVGFAVNGETTTVEGAMSNLDIDTSGNPMRIGRIYKLQSILAWDAGGGGMRMAFNVDGVQINEVGLAGAGLATAAGNDVMRIGGTGEGASDRFQSLNIRYGQFEVIQAMFEFDRTISFDGSGAITTVDADSDPFTDLTFSGSAADGALYVLDEGSGNPQDTSGNSRHATLTNGVWAGTDPEPTFPSLGTARWDMDHIEGLDLRESDAPDAVPYFGPGPDAPGLTSGEVRLAKTPRYYIFDGEQTAPFSPTTQLSVSNTEVWEGGNALKAAAVSGIVSHRTGVTPPTANTERWWLRAQFYDPNGSTGNRVQRVMFDPSVGATILHIGRTNNISGSFYSTRVNGATVQNQATTVAVGEGWHEFLVWWESTVAANDTIEFYVDGSLERTETSVNVVAAGRFTIRTRGDEATNDHGFYDEIELAAEGLVGIGALGSNFAGLVESSGSIVLQLLQPAEGVKQFTGVTITDEQSGSNSFEIGTITYTFRHSTDGGSSWGSSTTLNDANLQALKCVGNGDDVLEITATFTSDLRDMASGALRQIDITYVPAIAINVLTQGAGFPVFRESCDSGITVL